MYEVEYHGEARIAVESVGLFEPGEKKRVDLYAAQELFRAAKAQKRRGKPVWFTVYGDGLPWDLDEACPWDIENDPDPDVPDAE